MSENISIGLLLPSSTVLPIGRDFERGVKKGLEGLRLQSRSFEIIPEFISEGSKEKTEQAMNKLLNYHHVDVITGVVSHKTTYGVIDKIKKNKRPLIINNIGENLPDYRMVEKNLFFNSMHTWQQVWSLGYWGCREFGPKGMFVGGVYDAGYSFALMLQMGMKAADPAAVMPFAVAPVQQMGGLADVTSVFQHIERYKPDFVFAAFCGEEAEMFLRTYKEEGWDRKVPLLATPFLMHPSGLDGTVDIFTSMVITADSEPDVDSQIRLGYNPFPQLGYETGLIIASAVLDSGDGDLAARIAATRIKSDRGGVGVGLDTAGREANVLVVKNSFNGRDALGVPVCQVKTLACNDPELIHQLDQPSSGWYNPYPGV